MQNTPNAPNAEYRGRFTIATNVELGAALNQIDHDVRRMNDNMHEQIEQAMRSLLPDSFVIVTSVPRAQQRREYFIGDGGESVVRKVTLVKLSPGAFPSSVTVWHNDLSGFFVLDGTQLSVDLGITQHGEKSVFVQNNDAAIDCALFWIHERLS